MNADDVIGILIAVVLVSGIAVIACAVEHYQMRQPPMARYRRSWWSRWVS